MAISVNRSDYMPYWELECRVNGEELHYFGCEAEDESEAIEIVLQNSEYQDIEIDDVYKTNN